MGMEKEREMKKGCRSNRERRRGRAALDKWKEAYGRMGKASLGKPVGSAGSAGLKEPANMEGNTSLGKLANRAGNVSHGEPLNRAGNVSHGEPLNKVGTAGLGGLIGRAGTAGIGELVNRVGSEGCGETDGKGGCIRRLAGFALALGLVFLQREPMALKAADYEARIDGTYYGRLEEAFNDAKPGDTVFVLKDCSVSETLVVNADGIVLKSEDAGSPAVVSRDEDFAGKDDYQEGAKSILVRVDGGSLATWDIILDGGAVLDGDFRNSGQGWESPLVYVRGTYRMESGTVLQNNYNTDGNEDNSTARFAGAVQVMEGGTFDMRGGIIRNCYTNGSGGGVHARNGSSVSMEAGNIWNCYGMTGGAMAFFGPAEVSGMTLSGNCAKTGGAVEIHHEVRLSGCVLENNRALLRGGAVGISGDCPVTVEGCLFAGNSAAEGSAASISDAGGNCRPVFRDCTITGNRVSENYRGAIHYMGKAGMILDGDIIVGDNTATGGTGCDIFFMYADAAPVSLGESFNSSSVFTLCGSDGIVSGKLLIDASSQGKTADTEHFTWSRDGHYTEAQGGDIYLADAPERYILFYDANNGGMDIYEDPGRYTSEDTVTVVGWQTAFSDENVKVGCIFAGWNAKADGTGADYQEGQEIHLAENLWLYAKWEEGDGENGETDDGRTEGGADNGNGTDDEGNGNIGGSGNGEGNGNTDGDGGGEGNGNTGGGGDGEGNGETDESGDDEGNGDMNGSGDGEGNMDGSEDSEGDEGGNGNGGSGADESINGDAGSEGNGHDNGSTDNAWDTGEDTEGGRENVEEDVKESIWPDSAGEHASGWEDGTGKDGKKEPVIQTGRFAFRKFFFLAGLAGVVLVLFSGAEEKRGKKYRPWVLAGIIIVFVSLSGIGISHYLEDGEMGKYMEISEVYKWREPRETLQGESGAGENGALETQEETTGREPENGGLGIQGETAGEGRENGILGTQGETAGKSRQNGVLGMKRETTGESLGNRTIEIKKSGIGREQEGEDIADYDWENLCSVNTDTAGWLYLPDSLIDFPVAAARDNEYYLSHDFTGAESRIGCLFMDKGTDSGDFNRVIYGHNMGAGSEAMFSTLLKYEEEKYFDKNRFLYFADVYGGSARYEVMAVVKYNVKDVMEWDFRERNFGSVEDYEVWMEQMQERALYFRQPQRETGRMITLSTCDRREYGKDGRFLVFASGI